MVVKHMRGYIKIWVCTDKWALLKPYLSSLRRMSRKRDKRSQSKFRPKTKPVEDKKLYCRNEKWESLQEWSKVDVKAG